MKTTFVLIVLALAFHIALIECASGPCDNIVVSYDGKDRKYSLKEIAETSWQVDKGGRIYRFGICKQIDYNCESTESFPRCMGAGASGSCISWDNDRSRRCFGKFTAHKFQATDNGLDLIYDEGDDSFLNGFLKTTFRIKCDKGKSKLQESDFTFEEGQETLTISFSHRTGCHGRGGLSPGSVMLIIIFVSLSVYLIAGIAINIAVRQKTGAEIIPNWGFWKGCPSLIFDGFMFVINKIRGTPSTYSTL